MMWEPRRSFFAPLSSPPYEGGVAAASADGVVLYSVTQERTTSRLEAVLLLRKEESYIAPRVC